MAPSHTPLFDVIYESISITADSHTGLVPPANSPRMAFLPADFSHAIVAARSEEPMVEEAQVAEEPDLSGSRYWCISYTVLFDGSVREPMTPLFPDETLGMYVLERNALLMANKC
jgi:hypothetical protein